MTKVLGIRLQKQFEFLGANYVNRLSFLVSDCPFEWKNSAATGQTVGVKFCVHCVLHFQFPGLQYKKVIKYSGASLNDGDTF